MEEIWRDIEGYEGRYQISNMGRVKSFVVDKQNGRIMSFGHNRDGYRLISIGTINVDKKLFLVHRLVAKTFIPNPEGLHEVNHKDENKENNCVENLEWCDRLYNMNYGNVRGKISESNINNEGLSKRIYSVDGYGNVEFFLSAHEAQRQTGIHHANICRTLKGITKHSGKREWYYA